MVKLIKPVCRRFTNPYCLKDNKKLRLGDVISIIRVEEKIERGEAKFYTIEEVAEGIQELREALYTEKAN